jgi:hypothetical protein
MDSNFNNIWFQKLKYYLIILASLIFLTFPSFLKMLVKGLREHTDIY